MADHKLRIIPYIILRSRVIVVFPNSSDIPSDRTRHTSHITANLGIKDTKSHKPQHECLPLNPIPSLLLTNADIALLMALLAKPPPA